jgi:hypothetical protein
MDISTLNKIINYLWEKKSLNMLIWLLGTYIYEELQT